VVEQDLVGPGEVAEREPRPVTSAYLGDYSSAGSADASAGSADASAGSADATVGSADGTAGDEVASVGSARPSVDSAGLASSWIARSRAMAGGEGAQLGSTGCNAWGHATFQLLVCL